MDSPPPVVVACRVLEESLAPLLPDSVRASALFLDYALHRTPAKMREHLQAVVDGVPEPSRVLLGYGLCGNGLDGLEAGRHTLVVPRVDDCIALLLGSREAYRAEFDREPGTFYLSKGWLEGGSDPKREYERYAEQYGPEDASWMMDELYRHYRRLALVAPNAEELARYAPRARAVAAYCARWGMRYEELLGSDAFLRRLAACCGGALPSGRDFVVAGPGARLRQSDFLHRP